MKNSKNIVRTFPFLDIIDSPQTKYQKGMFLMNTIISEKCGDDKKIKTIIDSFFKEYKIGTLLKQSNFYKQKGFSCLLVFKYIFMLI
ncbi:hypothetical protein, partial [Paramaledivibacter caminithermalis]